MNINVSKILGRKSRASQTYLPIDYLPRGGVPMVTYLVDIGTYLLIICPEEMWGLV